MSLKLASGLLVVVCIVGGKAAWAEEAIALIPGNTLIRFDTATPGTVTASVAITGLGVNQTVRGIDYRAITGEVFASAVTSLSAANSVIFTYKIDPATGVATLIGQTAALLTAADVPTGYDRNPVTGSFRFVNINDLSARINPSTGGLVANDNVLTPGATTTIIAAAYDRNTLNSAVTTLYEIDQNDSQVAIQGGIDGSPSPNGGAVTDLCPLGFTLNPVNDGGFDISSSGIAYAALTDAADNLTRLYTITLPTAVSGTPCATAVGLIGNGLTEIYSLTILPPDSDGDGVRDPLDGCPNDPNKTDPGACGCGNPETDSDGDFVPDCIDGCPSDPNKTDPGACGCGNPETDSDGDFVPDCVDGCPNDPAKIAPGFCGCGMPDTDSDGDGFPDCIDECPNDAAKIAPGFCGCGNPETDTDGDGLPDCVDQCPENPNLIKPIHCGHCGCLCGTGMAVSTPLTLLLVQLHRRRGIRRGRWPGGRAG